MERVGAVIGGQLKPVAIQLERAVRDPVGIAPDRRAEKAPNRNIAGEIVPAEHHIRKAPGAIRHEDRLQRRAIGDEAHLEAVVAAQPHHFHGAAAVRQLPESRSP